MLVILIVYFIINLFFKVLICTLASKFVVLILVIDYINFDFFNQDFRKAISVHYASSNCNYIDVTGTTQENIKNEIIDVMAKRGFVDVDFIVSY